MVYLMGHVKKTWSHPMSSTSGFLVSAGCETACGRSFLKYTGSEQPRHVTQCFLFFTHPSSQVLPSPLAAQTERRPLRRNCTDRLAVEESRREVCLVKTKSSGIRQALRSGIAQPNKLKHGYTMLHTKISSMSSLQLPRILTTRCLGI